MITLPTSSKSKPVLLKPPGKEYVEHVCAVLNSEKDVSARPELERLVQLWLNMNPDLDGAWNPIWAGDGYEDIRESWQCYFDMTQGTRRCHLQLGPRFKWDTGPPEKRARMLFGRLLLVPECEKLAGPCPRCGRYFIKKTLKQKLYCSRSCGSRESAEVATYKRREEEHAEKLTRAMKTTALWNPRRSRQSWKEWVSSRHPDITPKWLTRAVHRGELTDPSVPRLK